MLLDQFLPEYHFSEKHALEVQAEPARVFAAVKRVDMNRSAVIKGLFFLRGLPHRLRGKARLTGRGTLTFDDLAGMGFIRLVDTLPDEMVLGLVGQFWKPAAKLCAVPPDKFRDFDIPGYCKAVWNIEARPTTSGRTRLATTTRIYCPGAGTRRLFTLYWMLIRPFSGLIRELLLRTIRREVESLQGGADP